MITFNYKYASIFQEENYVHKIVPQTVYKLYQFYIRIYLESFESIYNLSTFCNLNITLNYWFIS